MEKNKKITFFITIDGTDKVVFGEQLSDGRIIELFSGKELLVGSNDIRYSNGDLYFNGNIENIRKVEMPVNQIPLEDPIGYDYEGIDFSKIAKSK